MARIEWVEERLKVWARWKANLLAGPLGYAAVNLADADAGRSGYIEASIPLLAVEAGETDEAIKLLDKGLQDTIREVYCGRGGVRHAARKMGVAESTLHARVDQAHWQISHHILERQERWRNKRTRDEAAQAAARPK